MRRHLPLGVLVLALAIALTAALSSAGRARQRALLPPPLPAGGFAFDPATPAGDREAFETAVAHARPEARRLVGLVDGAVSVRIGDPGGGAVGSAQGTGEDWTVIVDIAAVWPRYRQRGVDRVVLHELGHVVDGALIDDPLRASLDAGIPRGWGCDDGRTGACAVRAERFAESFMKWATDDIGVDVWLGYKVPPPGPTLAAWGAPLARVEAPKR